jgi:hypothetical protein
MPAFAVALVGVLLAAAPPAQAQRSWRDAEPVGGSSAPDLVMSPDGTATVFYGDENRGTLAVSKAPGEPLGGPQAIAPNMWPLHAAIDARGTTHVLVQDRNWGLAVIDRPSGGQWSPPDPLPTRNASNGELAVNRDGDVAVLVRTGDGPDWKLKYYGAFRPRGEHFGELLPMGPVPEKWHGDTAALTSEGELIALYETGDSTTSLPRQVYAMSRTATEPAQPPQLLSSPEQSGYAPYLAVDDHGRAAAVWTEDPRTWEVPDWGPVRAYMALRQPGAPFGARTMVPTMNGWVSRLVMGPDGRITIASLYREVDILTAPFGEPLKAEKRADVSYGSPAISLAASPGGRTLFNWSATERHALAMAGDTDGRQERILDVRPGCEEVTGGAYRKAVVNDAGQAAILFRTGATYYLATDGAAERPPATECVPDPAVYGHDMKPALKPWVPPVQPPSPWEPEDHGPFPTPPDQTPPGGSPPDTRPAGDPVPPPPPVGDPPPIGPSLSLPPLQLRRGNARVTSDGTKVLARVVASCPTACSLQVKPTLELGRGWRLTGRAKRARLRSGGGPVTIHWKLPAGARRTVRQRRSVARLRIRVVANAGGTRSRRSLVLRISG